MKAFEHPYGERDYIYARERLERWTEWMGEVPSIEVPRGCTITVIPPFAGATARFVIKDKKGICRVSVYLDSASRLGCSDTIYWEVYPVGGDCARCDMEDRDSLMNYINQSLKEQRKQHVKEARQKRHQENST